MICITTCVNYHDYLAVTLPRMISLCDRVFVVTSHADEATRVLVLDYAHRHPGRIVRFATDAFYAHNAHFSKGRALNTALAWLLTTHINDWLLVMDADILLPSTPIDFSSLVQGNLYGCCRRASPLPVPPESDWTNLTPCNDRVTYIPGFFQLFHSTDPHFLAEPLYPIWLSAAGCDDDFSNKWPPSCQQRLPLTTLHLAPERSNWVGRVTPYLDGSTPPHAAEYAKQLQIMLDNRKRFGYKLERLTQ